jgi:bifunctional UDP-N-acetylglucosamine pyrophosphorylase / glucosamine-1-phosphate N-acetyltransferase
MSRLLVIPAAGLGSRLGASLPKVLVRVAGEPMLDRLLALYRDAVDHVVVVVNPLFSDLVRNHVESRGHGARVECVEQPSPTGMLDAILLGIPIASRVDASSIWVTWCDQIAVHPRTIARLADLTSTNGHDALVMPTVHQEHPYIHLERDSTGRIVRVLHRREGDVMPDIGESDMGLFGLSRKSYLEWLPAYARGVEIGRATGERNFLPFIPWIARTETVTTFAAHDAIEAVGVNTPDDLAMVERYLASAQGIDRNLRGAD